jgi:hypothetical protein
MKTPLFFLAALIAFFVLPLDFTTSVSVLFVAGFAAITVHDYRTRRPYAATAGASVASAGRERFRLAA